MVVAQSGLGKSTFINSMFRSDIYSRKGISDVPLKTVTIDCHKVILEENGVKLYLTVVDTPGFNDQLDNRQCCQPIAAFLEEQFQRFLQAETAVHRDNYRTPGYTPASISLLPVGMDSKILMYSS